MGSGSDDSEVPFAIGSSCVRLGTVRFGVKPPLARLGSKSNIPPAPTVRVVLSGKALEAAMANKPAVILVPPEYALSPRSTRMPYRPS